MSSPGLVQANRFEQVLTSSIDNALRYSPRGGAIEIEAWVESPPGGGSRFVLAVPTAQPGQSGRRAREGAPG